MSSFENAFLILSILILIGCLIYVFFKIVVTTVVKKSSKVLKEIETINGKIKYKNIQPNYYYSYDCSSRANFNHFILDQYLIEIINDNESFFEKLIMSIEHNKKELAKYKRLLGKIDFSQTENIAKSIPIPVWIYKRVEKKLSQKRFLPAPIIDITILCRKEYTTSAGRTHVWTDSTYNYKQLLCFREEARKIKEQRTIRSGQIEYERSLMTPSMRYNILQRDNFKCQICGSTAQDGVKLHIDHIKPISKGGRTTPDNLRVLCDRCNLGKGAKIE